MEWVCLVGGVGLVLVFSVVWWRRVGALEWWKRRQVESGAWELRDCPTCRGTGRCRSCQGMGTIGLMGPPCMDCGGGSQAVRDPGYNPEAAGERARGQDATGEPQYEYTAMGSGRCGTCGGTGQGFYERETGRTIANNPAAIAAARQRQ
jgi:hypothetical protein